MKKTKEVENNNSKNYLTPEEYLGGPLSDASGEPTVYNFDLVGSDYDVSLEEWPLDCIHIVVSKNSKEYRWSFMGCDIKKSILSETDTETNLIDIYKANYEATVDLGLTGGQA